MRLPTVAAGLATAALLSVAAAPASAATFRQCKPKDPATMSIVVAKGMTCTKAMAVVKKAPKPPSSTKRFVVSGLRCVATPGEDGSGSKADYTCNNRARTKGVQWSVLDPES